MFQSVWQWLGFLASIVAVIGFFWWVIQTVRKIHKTIMDAIKEREDLSEKISTLWAFHMSRGRLEAIEGHKNLAREEATYEDGHVIPVEDRRLVLTRRFRSCFDVKRLDKDGKLKEITVAQELHDAYRTRHFSREQMQMWISRELKNWLIDDICLPFSVSEAGCIALAMAVAEED